MKKATIIYNPVSGSGKGKELCQLLEKKLEGEFDLIESLATNKAKDGIVFAKSATVNGCHSIFAIGGDGTVNEVVQGIIEAETENKPILGIVPGGTFNGVSRILGFPQNPKEAIDSIKFNKTIIMDTGRFNNHIFNMIFSIGDVPEALHNVSNEEKSSLSVLAYAFNVAKDAIKNSHYKIKVIYDGDEIIGNFSHIVVMLSSALYGTPISDEIKRNDGFLHMFILKESTFLNKFSILPDLITGAVTKNENIKYIKTKKVRIESLEGNIETDVDGDKADLLPADIEILPKALKIYTLN